MRRVPPIDSRRRPAMLRLLPMGMALAVAAPAAAQGGWAVEVRGGAAIGNHAAAASELALDPGPSFGGTVAYGATRTVEVYAGYSRAAFRCTTGFCPERGMDFSSHGAQAGVRLTLPWAAAPWVRAGVVRQRLDYASGMDDPDPSSGRAAGGAGFELGGGVRVRLGRTLAATPGVRYVRYGGGGEGAVALLVGDVGLRLRL